MLQLVPLHLEFQAVLCFQVFQAILVFQRLPLDPVLLATLHCQGCQWVPCPLSFLCHQSDP